MRYVNSILALRLLNCVLIFWLLFQLPTLFHQIFNRIRRSPAAEEDQSERRVDSQSAVADDQQSTRLDDLLHRNLPTGSQRVEVIRINELFARPQHKCRDRGTVGGPKDSFFVCLDWELVADDGIFKDALLLSGMREVRPGKGEFEAALNTSLWTLVVPERNALVERVRSDVVLQYMPELADEGTFPRDRIAGILDAQPEQHQFGLAKLELYSEALANGERDTESTLGLLRWTLKRLRAKQLLLVVRPGEDPKALKDAEGRVILLWYRLFAAELFHSWHFALLGVRSNGKCGQAMQQFGARHCEWRASFVHFEDLWAAQDVPAYGFGSPLEEKMRFLAYLLKSTNSQDLLPGDCPILPSSSSSFPSICANKESGRQKMDLLLYIRYKPLSTSSDWEELKGLAGECARMAFVSPVDVGHSEKLPGNVFNISVGISPYPGNESIALPLSNENKWLLSKVVPFPVIFQSAQVLAYEANILLLDMDGAEWDVMELLTAKALCDDWLRSFQQINFRIRLWAMEESENWRRYYLWLLRLEECQFEKTVAKRIDQSVLLIAYRRKRIVPAG